VKPILDISFRFTGLARELSNLYPYQFEMDGIIYESMESFFQALKIGDQAEKEKIYKMSGYQCWKYGQKFDWKTEQIIHYKDIKLNRISSEYTNLIREAYSCLMKNENYKNKIIESLPYKLDHTIGKTNPTLKLLTKKEFLTNLEILQNLVKPKRFYGLFN
jgi:hypothetical protein